MEYIIFIWDGGPNNYVTVCLESLRLYNKNCKILFYYKIKGIISAFDKYNIIFFTLIS